MRTDIHLASSSPRRREILAAMGIRFTAAGVDIDETRYDGADTAVALDDHVLGKPGSEGEAVEMLTSLSGRAHKVLTGVALDYAGEIMSITSVTEVRFREIRHDEAFAYWQSGEPRDKAGAYAVQGIGGIFVEYISGSYSGVVGLPVFETAELLSKAGLVVLPLDSDR
jgi:septum formation protein